VNFELAKFSRLTRHRFKEICKNGETECVNIVTVEGDTSPYDPDFGLKAAGMATHQPPSHLLCPIVHGGK